MANYKLSPNAAVDVERIWLFGLEQWGETQADKYINELYQKFSYILANPYHYPVVDEISNKYHRCAFGRDSIYYRITNNDIEIMAIIGQQDLKNWLS